VLIGVGGCGWRQAGTTVTTATKPRPARISSAAAVVVGSILVWWARGHSRRRSLHFDST